MQVTSFAAKSLTQDVSMLGPDAAQRIGAELRRQQRGLEIISSENHTAQAVMQAQGSVLHGDGPHTVTLNSAIETLRLTGADMKSKYKESSGGGLALPRTLVLNRISQPSEGDSCV